MTRSITPKTNGWNLNMMVSKRNLLLQRSTSRWTMLVGMYALLLSYVERIWQGTFPGTSHSSCFQTEKSPICQVITRVFSSCNIAGHSTHMEVSLNGGTQQPWVFLLKMIILGCFGGTTILGNLHIFHYLPLVVGTPPTLPAQTYPHPLAHLWDQ